MSLTRTLNNADWSTVLSSIDPFAFAGVGSALALTLCVLGAAWSVATGWVAAVAPGQIWVLLWIVVRW